MKCDNTQVMAATSVFAENMPWLSDGGHQIVRHGLIYQSMREKPLSSHVGDWHLDNLLLVPGGKHIFPYADSSAQVICHRALLPWYKYFVQQLVLCWPCWLSSTTWTSSLSQWSVAGMKQQNHLMWWMALYNTLDLLHPNEMFYLKGFASPDPHQVSYSAGGQDKVRARARLSDAV